MYAICMIRDCVTCTRCSARKLRRCYRRDESVRPSAMEREGDRQVICPSTVPESLRSRSPHAFHSEIRSGNDMVSGSFD